MDKVIVIFKKYKKGMVAFLGLLATASTQITELLSIGVRPYFSIGIALLVTAGVVQVRNEDPNIPSL